MLALGWTRILPGVICYQRYLNIIAFICVQTDIDSKQPYQHIDNDAYPPEERYQTEHYSNNHHYYPKKYRLERVQFKSPITLASKNQDRDSSHQCEYISQYEV